MILPTSFIILVYGLYVVIHELFTIDTTDDGGGGPR